LTSPSQHDVDLFVIGAGSGGVRAARIAAGYGARVMIAEEYRVGGTCVIRGCVPKKLLVYASRFFHEFEDAAGFGWTVPPATFDWPTLIANKDKEIARLEAAYTTNLDKSGVTTVKSRAVIEDPHTIRLLSNGAMVRADQILIATGGAPDMGPAIPGIEHTITSNEAFHLPALPARILIRGGGYIAVEFACIFAGLGAQVTYSDPYVPCLRVEEHSLEAVPPVRDVLASCDMALIVTNHSDFDYAEIVQSAPLVFDTRNATEGMKAKNLVRL